MDLMPLYRELHAYLRYYAIKTYNNTFVTEDDGAIPAPIFDQILAQAWYGRMVFRAPYPRNALPQVHNDLQDKIKSALIINEKAEKFFQSLGLHNLSRYFITFLKYHQNIFQLFL